MILPVPNVTMYKQKPSTQGITLGKRLTLKVSPSGYCKSGYYMTGYYIMQASSFLPLSNIHYHYQHHQLSTTINTNHPYHQQPSQLNQPTPKTGKDLHKTATPGIPDIHYVKRVQNNEYRRKKS